jgi:hypothetical protein
VKSGFRIVPLRVALALSATIVIASHAKASSAAETVTLVTAVKHSKNLNMRRTTSTI